jgi:hypothetical protein
MHLLSQGNGVTAVQQLVQCVNDLIMSPTDAARSSYVCVVGASGPLMTTQVLINGIVRSLFLLYQVERRTDDGN